jgi:putative NADH-flavin reductase
MRLFLIGATGRTGRAVMDQALERGHTVTAFARSPEKLGASVGRVTVVRGDPRRPSELQAALPGADAVISTLGPPVPSFKRTTILGDGAAAAVAAMQAAGVRRLLIVSGDIQFEGQGPLLALMRATLLRQLARDQAALERATTSSDLDWTIVRPTRLTNGALTRAYRAEPDRLPTPARGISRADVAHFLLAAAERGEHVRRVVGLAR